MKNYYAMNKTTTTNKLDVLIEKISSHYDYSINKATTERIEKILDIVNEDFNEDYDFIVTKDYWYWGIQDGSHLNYNLAQYYNLEAKYHFQRKNYRRALFFLHLAEFYILKEDLNSEDYQYYLLVTLCNKCFTLLFLNKAQKALTGFQSIAVYASYNSLNYAGNYFWGNELTNESTACKISIQLGEALCLIELGKLHNAELSINTITLNLVKESYKDFCEKHFVLKTLIAKIFIKRQDKNSAFNIIADAIIEGFPYVTEYSGHLQEEIIYHLRQSPFEGIGFNYIIETMLETHIKRDISVTPSRKDILFV